MREVGATDPAWPRWWVPPPWSGGDPGLALIPQPTSPLQCGQGLVFGEGQGGPGWSSGLGGGYGGPQALGGARGSLVENLGCLVDPWEGPCTSRRRFGKCFPTKSTLQDKGPSLDGVRALVVCAVPQLSARLSSPHTQQSPLWSLSSTNTTSPVSHLSS